MYVNIIYSVDWILLFIEHLKDKLDDYIKLWNGLVKVFRNERREGLIQARSIGAQKAKLGQVGNIWHFTMSTSWIW